MVRRFPNPFCVRSGPEMFRTSNPETDPINNKKKYNVRNIVRFYLYAPSTCFPDKNLQQSYPRMII
jgi:hypothetical protein